MKDYKLTRVIFKILLEEFSVGIFVPVILLFSIKFFFDVLKIVIMEVPYLNIIIYLIYGFCIYLILLFIVSVYQLIKNIRLFINFFKHKDEINDAFDHLTNEEYWKAVNEIKQL